MTMPNPTAAPLPKLEAKAYGISKNYFAVLRFNDWERGLTKAEADEIIRIVEASRAPSLSREGLDLANKLDQHLKDCVDYIETHRPMNTPRCKEWEDANHFMLYDWLEFNRQALSALEPSTGKAGWVPIETADHGTPKSAEVWASPDMLLFDGSWICVGSYNVGEEEWWDAAGPLNPQPTHWQPLPPPPGAETPKETKP